MKTKYNRYDLEAWFYIFMVSVIATSLGLCTNTSVGPFEWFARWIFGLIAGLLASLIYVVGISSANQRHKEQAAEEQKQNVTKGE